MTTPTPFAEQRRDLALTIRRNLGEFGMPDGIEQTTADGAVLRICGRLMLQTALDHGVPFSAAGGRGPYATGLAQAMAMESAGGQLKWFALREKPRDHATERLVEGGRIGAETVVVVDTGADDDNFLAACHDTQNRGGAQIAAGVTLVDFDNGARERFAREFPAAAFAAVLTRSDIVLS